MKSRDTVLKELGRLSPALSVSDKNSWIAGYLAALEWVLEE